MVLRRVLEFSPSRCTSTIAFAGQQFRCLGFTSDLSAIAFAKAKSNNLSADNHSQSYYKSLGSHRTSSFQSNPEPQLLHRMKRLPDINLNSTLSEESRGRPERKLRNVTFMEMEEDSSVGSTIKRPGGTNQSNSLVLSDFSRNPLASSTEQYSELSEKAKKSFVSSDSKFVSSKHAGRYGSLASSVKGDKEESNPSSLDQLIEHQGDMRSLFKAQPTISIGAAGVPNIPLLPVSYLRYHSHGRRRGLSSTSSVSQRKGLSNDLGIPTTSTATPYLSRPEERLHALRQRNLLAQIGARSDQIAQITPTTPTTQISKALKDSPGSGGRKREKWEAARRLPFRCLRCFHVFEALPSKLLGCKEGNSETSLSLGSVAAIECERSHQLKRAVKFRSRGQYAAWKSMNTIAARREEEQRNPTRCPKCRGDNVQWLMEFCHRSRHTSRLR